MLFVLTGSSCSGKTTIAHGCAETDGLVVHDTDEAGVPPRADRQWRQRTLETWLQRALELQEHGVDLLLTAQSPLGEVLACPSADRLEGIAVCLVDVRDDERRRRLAERDPGRWDGPAVDAFLGWARWHRSHAVDPRDRPDVVTRDGWPAMQWDRWRLWEAGDTRWVTAVLDTTDASAVESTAAVRAWVSRGRQELREGRLSLGPGWTVTTEGGGPGAVTVRG